MLKPIAMGIQSGANTHHHDQAITSVNFNTINTTSNGVAIEDDWLTVFTVDFISLSFYII